MFDARTGRIWREVFLALFGTGGDDFDPWVLDRLTLLLDEQRVRAGQVLWAGGKAVESLYFMHQGRVRLTREGAAPWTFEGRWFLGSFEGHLGRPASRQAVAVTDLNALKIRRRAWLDLLEDSFDLTRRGIVSAATTVARLDERVAAVVPVTPRVHTLTTRPKRALNAIERLAFLTEVEMARGAGVQALADLAAASHEVRLNDGNVLLRPGEGREYLYLIVDGRLEAAWQSPQMKRRYTTGDVVGGAAALSEAANDWEAKALSAARLLAVPIEAWFDLMEEHFELAHSTFAFLAEHRERILDHLAAEAGPQGIVLT